MTGIPILDGHHMYIASYIVYNATDVLYILINPVQWRQMSVM